MKNELFRTRLREMMIARSLSQSELARQSDVPVSSINRFLSGKSTPSDESLTRLAKTLKVPINWLSEGLTREQKPKEENLQDRIDRVVKQHKVSYSKIGKMAQLSPKTITNVRDSVGIHYVNTIKKVVKALDDIESGNIPDDTKIRTGNTKIFADNFNRLLEEDIKHHRNNRQQDIAKRLGISSASVIYYYINGKVLPKQYNLNKIAKYFNVSVEDLVGKEYAKTLKNTTAEVKKATNKIKRAISTANNEVEKSIIELLTETNNLLKEISENMKTQKKRKHLVKIFSK